MKALLNKMSFHSLFGTMLASVALTCLAAYLYGFKEPLKTYKLLQMEGKILAAKVAGTSGMSLELERIQTEIDALARQLQGETPPLTHSKMVAHVINRLDSISSKHDVQLLGVKPAAPATVKYFEELPFGVEVAGSYFSLFDWLQEVEMELGPMIVKKITMETIGGTQEQILRLNMASYRLQQVIK